MAQFRQMTRLSDYSKCIIFIFLLSGLVVHARAQSANSYIPAFHSSGNMQVTDLDMDTIFRQVVPAKGILFEHIDRVRLPDTAAFYPLLRPYLNATNDSTEYFYLYNGTTTPLTIPRLKRKFMGITIARNRKGEVLPVNCLVIPHCVTGIYADMTLPAGALMVLRQNVARLKGGFRTKAKLRLATKEQGILLTKSYTISIDELAFFINREHESAAHLGIWNFLER